MDVFKMKDREDIGGDNHGGSWYLTIVWDSVEIYMYVTGERMDLYIWTAFL